MAVVVVGSSSSLREGEVTERGARRRASSEADSGSVCRLPRV
ncbi:hypothetical protein PC116_g32833 [Phytophthora cactorum]|nr:hypothetical protein PC116_g32833 [Phytophthora cactorum]